MDYTLKDKLQINKEFLADLETKSWQEIEHLQAQIANIEATPENLQLIQLFKNLLTSYYIFVGGLENIGEIKAPVITDKICLDKEQTSVPVEKAVGSDDYHDESCEDDIFEPVYAEKPDSKIETDIEIEPFEYFVDFDDPIGEPLSDEDIYGK